MEKSEMKKILIAGLSIVVFYSILVYAYGIDCQGPLNSSNNWHFFGNVVPQYDCNYYVGCAANDYAIVRIAVYDFTNPTEILNTVDYFVKNSNHFFDALEGHNHQIFVGSN